MKNRISLFSILSFVLTCTGCSNAPVIKYVDSFENKYHPQIVYWAWDNHTINNKQYLRDIDKIAGKSPYDMAFITSRFDNGIGLCDTTNMKPFLKEAVEHAHQKGLKIGLQIWTLNRTREFMLPTRAFEKEDAEALMAEGRCLLDANGKGLVKNQATSARYNQAFAAELSRVYLFREKADKVYEASTLVEAEPAWLTVKQNEDSVMVVSIQAPSEYAGYTAYVLTAHYYNFYDVFSPKHKQVFKEILDAYSDISFDGTALDEQGAMGIKPNWVRGKGEIMTDRVWGDCFATCLKQQLPGDPLRLLFDMRYAPEGNSAIKIKAINTYFDLLSKGSVGVEQFFYDYSKKTFGKECFAGVHSTFHNVLYGDDIWTTGISWWDVSREYGQTDEYQPMPDRMGIGMSGNQPVMYNMFYHKEKERMYEEALNKAAYGVRIHYHGWNDSQGWGKNLEDDDFLEGLRPVEERLRILNLFNPVAPVLPLLVVYNLPYQFNWYPDKEQQNQLDIRNCDMQSVAASVWKAGYPCASIPDTWIDRGLLTVTPEGKVELKGRTFDAVLFLNPQYARKSSFDFMEQLVDKGGRLMIQGTATRNFDGDDCSDLFQRIIAHSLPFSTENLPKLGIGQNMINNGIKLTDGSVVMSDYSSVENNENTNFSFNTDGHLYSGSYQGVFALKTNKDGDIDKLVCGNFQSLKRDGVEILSLDSPTDIVVLKKEGRYEIRIKGEASKHHLLENDLK